MRVFKDFEGFKDFEFSVLSTCKMLPVHMLLLFTNLQDDNGEYIGRAQAVCHWRAKWQHWSGCEKGMYLIIKTNLIDVLAGKVGHDKSKFLIINTDSDT